jgi:predicted secreted acid phosphatase
MLVVDILRRVFTRSCCVHRTETYNATSWDEWVALGEAPALAASLKLYKELQQLGFTIVLLTGRDEYQRNVTVKNLLAAGYTDWETLFLRYIYIKFKQWPLIERDIYYNCVIYILMKKNETGQLKMRGRRQSCINLKRERS